MPSTKEAARAHLRAVRQAMSDQEVRRASRTIVRRVADIIDWHTVASLHTYDPIPGAHEVDTLLLLRTVWREYPFIRTATWPQERTHGTQAQWITAEGRQDFVPDGFTFDLIIVPLLGFNDDCHRIGFGGGYYDRFLATQPEALTVGLGYESARTMEFKPETYDIALDYVVTEKAVYRKLSRSTGAKSSRITRSAS